MWWMTRVRWAQDRLAVLVAFYYKWCGIEYSFRSGVRLVLSENIEYIITPNLGRASGLTTYTSFIVRSITPPVPRLLSLQLFALTTTDRRVACCGNPIRSAVRPHAEHTVVDCRVIDLLSFRDALPHGIETVEPNMICIFQSVVVNIKVPDSRCDIFGGTRKVLGRCGGIPGCVSRRTAGKLATLLDRDGLGSRGRQRGCHRWCCRRVRCCRRRRRSRVGDRLDVGGST